MERACEKQDSVCNLVAVFENNRNLRRRGSCESFWRRSRPMWLACTCLTRCSSRSC
uniref:FYVE, RhoGEF and PH domain containing 2 n=1 Tax=Mus musculus TaxID=10090 RepID=A0A3Q4EC83_MOUSE